MDFNYITLIVCIVGFVSTLLTHKYHINLHSKKLQKIEKDISNLMLTVESITAVADPKIEPTVSELKNVYDKITNDLNKNAPVG